MPYRVLADGVLVAHLAFVAFAVAGGFLVLRWRRVAWFHLPAVAWAAWVEFAGRVCPLTPLENWLRLRGGRDAYAGGFIEHHLVPVLYPEALSRELQIALGAGVLILNLGIYAWVLQRRRRAPSAPGDRG